MGKRIGAVKQGAHTYGRIHLDQWFTKPEDAARLVADLFSEMPELRGKRFIEPSAGAGAFVEALLSKGQKVEHYDLEPNYPGTIQRDWLLEETDCTDAVVIGNPPYGYHNKLSKDFTIRAFEQGASHVAFLVPLGFMRSACLNVNRRIEYFKTISCSFLGSDGAELKGGEKGPMVWVVFSSGQQNDFKDYFELPRDTLTADSFWLSGERYDRSFFEKIERYTKTGAPRAFKGYWGGRSKIGIAMTSTLPLDFQDTSTLELIAKCSGNRIQPPVVVTNFWLSNPELYRGWID